MELELKFRVEPEDYDAIRVRFAQARTIAMETTYFDTPDGSLSRRRWTLRRRLENGVSLCTLKTPGEGIAREEWETEDEDILHALDGLIAQGAPAELKALAQGGLEPVCGARFTRLALDCRLPACRVELALDRGVLTGGGRELPFQELEAEWKEGSQEAALACGEALARQYGLKPEPASKIQRAMALARKG